jgi:hypothetical protein
MNQFHRFCFGNRTAPIFIHSQSINPIRRGATNVTAQAWLNTNLVRLQKAVLCANCEVISEGLNGHCVACGSQALLRLSRLLGGTTKSELSFTSVMSTHIASDAECVCYLSAAA